MWVIATYEATTLFSLKPANATSSGGRTLLVPTPYAIKMAIIDVVCRTEGVHLADDAMAWLRSAQVAIKPPKRIVVNNTFMKVLRPRRNPAKPGTQDAGYFQRTIAYREYAQFGDEFAVALAVEDDEQALALSRWLMGVNYLGKRGGFIQVQALPTVVNELEASFIIIDGTVPDTFALDSFMTQLDDTGDDLSFEKANIYSKKRIRLGKERVLKHVVLPYRLRQSSRGYSYYERADDA